MIVHGHCFRLMLIFINSAEQFIRLSYYFIRMIFLSDLPTSSMVSLLFLTCVGRYCKSFEAFFFFPVFGNDKGYHEVAESLHSCYSVMKELQNNPDPAVLLNVSLSSQHQQYYQYSHQLPDLLYLYPCLSARQLFLLVDHLYNFKNGTRLLSSCIQFISDSCGK